MKIKKSKLRRKIENVAQKKWFDKDCRIKQHHLQKLSSQKHKDPNNMELRNNYHNVLKSYKETLQVKHNQFHQNKIDELEKASENDINLFWELLKKSTDDLENDKV